MTSSPIIQSIQAWDFNPLFRDGPYAMSHVVQETIFSRILCIQTESGLQGLGEIILPPSAPRSALLEWNSAEADIINHLIGKSIDAITSQVERILQSGKPWNGVAFGLETAGLDLQGQLQGRNLTDLLGGLKCQHMNDYFSISEKHRAKLKERLVLAGPHRKVLQLKLGMGSMQEDEEQVALTLELMNNNQILLADANGGWSIDRSCETIKLFNDKRLYWEEPCDNYDDNVVVARQTDATIMFDQCVGIFDVAMRAIDEGVADAICIKPAFLGGLEISRVVRDRCAEAGIKMRIDGPWCGDIATAATLHLAAGAPQELLIASCDLREPLDLKHNLHGARCPNPGQVAPPIGNGLGLKIDTDCFGEPDASYRPSSEF